MSTLLAVSKELIGLFIDDGSLAIAIAALVLLSAMFAAVDAPSLVTGSLLLVGCLAVLLENVFRTIRKK
jgi:hypothetical protein